MLFTADFIVRSYLLRHFLHLSNKHNNSPIAAHTKYPKKGKKIKQQLHISFRAQICKEKERVADKYNRSPNMGGKQNNQQHNSTRLTTGEYDIWMFA